MNQETSFEAAPVSMNHRVVDGIALVPASLFSGFGLETNTEKSGDPETNSACWNSADVTRRKGISCASPASQRAACWLTIGQVGDILVLILLPDFPGVRL